MACKKGYFLKQMSQTVLQSYWPIASLCAWVCSLGISAASGNECDIYSSELWVINKELALALYALHHLIVTQNPSDLQNLGTFFFFSIKVICQSGYASALSSCFLITLSQGFHFSPCGQESQHSITIGLCCCTFTACFNIEVPYSD